jgi:N-acyl-D-aspartate/D-glutamate deacylase
VLDKAVPWGWQSWREYIEQAGSVKSTVDIVPLVGLSPLRHAVMGDAAFDRAATEEERESIVAAVRDCLEAGAHGVSLSFIDTDSGGRPVPSRLADDTELTAILTALVESGHGIAQFNGGYDQVEHMGRLCRATGAPATWVQLITYADRPNHHRELLEQAARLRSEGVNIRPQVSPRPLVFQLNFSGTMMFLGLDLWNDFANAPRARKFQLHADEEWRARARQEWEHAPGTMFPLRNLEKVALVPTSQDYDMPDLPATLGELHARRGGHPSDLLLDWTAEHDMEPGLIVTVANDDTDQIAELLRDPNTLVAASDVGAHVQMMAAYGDPSLLLTRHVLERGDLSLETAIRRLSAEPAEFLGLHDRGVLEVGRRADIAIIDLAELEYLPEQIDRRSPGHPCYTRAAKGIRATIVNGYATQIDSTLTGERPGGFLAE